MGKSFTQDFPYGFSFCQRAALVKVACGNMIAPADVSGIRNKVAGDDSEKRGLSLAIGPDKSHMLALQKPKGRVLQDASPAEAVGYIFYR
jgi:hypothetical protein